MSRTTLRRTLVTLLEQTTGKKVVPFTDSLTFREDLGLDSVDLASLVMDLQDRLRIDLALTELEHVSNVGELLDVLQGRLTARPEAA